MQLKSICIILRGPLFRYLLLLLVRDLSPFFQKVVEYMSYHQTKEPRKIEKPLRSTNLKTLVEAFDADFVEVDQETLFKLLLCANYMHISSLLELTCAKVASMLKGRSPEQIRKTFNICGDYTPEEEEEVRREYRDLID